MAAVSVIYGETHGMEVPKGLRSPRTPWQVFVRSRLSRLKVSSAEIAFGSRSTFVTVRWRHHWDGEADMRRRCAEWADSEGVAVSGAITGPGLRATGARGAAEMCLLGERVPACDAWGVAGPQTDAQMPLAAVASCCNYLFGPFDAERLHYTVCRAMSVLQRKTLSGVEAFVLDFLPVFMICASDPIHLSGTNSPLPHVVGDRSLPPSLRPTGVRARIWGGGAAARRLGGGRGRAAHPLLRSTQGGHSRSLRKSIAVSVRAASFSSGQCVAPRSAFGWGRLPTKAWARD